MLAVIDGDLVSFPSAASCEPTKAKLEREPLEAAIQRADETMQRILYETRADTYKMYIGGEENFRYKIDPTYKANRSDKPRPMWLQPVREHLVMKWNAQIADGIETDDAVGIAYCTSEEEAVIASYDKDLLQLTGTHYNFKRAEWYHIDERTGWVNFYTQLVVGDKSDNIMGYDGKMRPIVPKFLQPTIDRIKNAGSPREMYEVVHEIYELGDDALYRNAQLLYIQRREGDTWHVPDA